MSQTHVQISRNKIASVRPSSFRTAPLAGDGSHCEPSPAKNRISKASFIAEIYVPSMCKKSTRPPRASASKLASTIPAVLRHDSRLQSRCHFTCGRYRSSDGCCSAGSMVGALMRTMCITPACCAYRTREIHRHTYCVWLYVEDIP